mgnify:CR=1 FL=1
MQVFGIIIVLTVGIFSVNYYLQSKFHANECVEELDGYIWHVNNYSFGIYQLMGWQNGSWGNTIEMNKMLLERTDPSGIPVSHRVECPEFGTESGEPS